VAKKDRPAKVERDSRYPTKMQIALTLLQLDVQVFKLSAA
jgi:hypothetical protein